MNILKLIKKDFRANWAYQLDSMVLVFAISTLFIYVMFLGNGKADPELIIYFAVMLMSTSAVSLVFMTMDYLYKMDQLFVSLPVTRTEIVVAKYLSSFVQVLLALPVHFMGVRLGAYIHGNPGDAVLEIIYNPFVWIVLGLVLLFFKSYAYPLYFKFGLGVGFAIHSAIQFLLIILFILSIQLFNLQLLIEQSVNWVSNQNSFMVFGVTVVALIALMSLSITISSKIFKNKEI